MINNNKAIFLSLAMCLTFCRQTLAISTCIPKDSIGCRLDQAEAMAEMEISTGLTLVGKNGFSVMGRAGLGHLPSELSAGADFRFHGDFNNWRDIGVYLKFGGLSPIQLSGHYLIETLRKVREQRLDRNFNVYRGYGMGVGAGWDFYAINLRTDITYYQFQEMLSNGETIPLSAYNLQNGLAVSLIISVPLQLKIDL